MTKTSKNQKGFTAVEGLVVILVLVVVGVVGYMIYHEQNKSNTAPVSTTSASKKAPATTTTKTAPPPTPSGIYAGWKQYCDSSNGYCFDYPSTWQLTSQSSKDPSSVTVTDPSDSVLMVYNNPYDGDAITGGSFIANLVAPLATSSKLSVIGGYWDEQTDGQEIPLYEVTNSSDITPKSVTSGKVQLVSNRFTDSGNVTNDGSMTLMPTSSNNELPVNQVDSWLNAPDTQTGVLILKSLSAD